jgi:hypothetical protein
MEVHQAPAATSILYQVPLDARSIQCFRNPENQTPESLNCAGVSIQLLGLITPGESVEETDVSGRTGRTITDIVRGLNVIHTPIVYESENTRYLTDIRDMLLPGFATIVLGYRESSIGHYFVLFKDTTAVSYILDAQTRTVYTGAEIDRYLMTQGFAGFIFIYGPSATEDELRRRAIDDSLARMLSTRLRLGGKNKKKSRPPRKNGKKTKKGRKHHAMRTRRR